MDYITLTEADKLLLARDRLRGLESDHYRISLTSEVAKESRMAQLEDERTAVLEEIARLEGNADMPDESELPEKTVDELRELAEQQDIEVKASWKKQDIIDALADTANG